MCNIAESLRRSPTQKKESLITEQLKFLEFFVFIKTLRRKYRGYQHDIGFGNDFWI